MDNTTPLSKIFNYSPLKLNKIQNTAFEKTLPTPTIEVVSEKTLIGIEIEMENMPDWAYPEYYWTPKKDGSLRNHGVEYVSSPLRASQIEWALNHLTNTLKRGEYHPKLGPRTSTHIHLNVRDLTKEQYKNLIILYAMFEKHFFKFADQSREQSLFCVPLYASPCIRKYADMIDTHTPRWHKYLALNVLPVMPNIDTGTYGTVEFRHLHGTMDKYLILSFVNSILCLKQEAMKWKHEELISFLKEANSTSGYTMLYNQIFGKYTCPTMTQQDFEYCISQIKRNLFKDIYRDTLSLSF